MLDPTRSLESSLEPQIKKVSPPVARLTRPLEPSLGPQIKQISPPVYSGWRRIVLQISLARGPDVASAP
eukprot:5541924-Pyramimonas_sp.AAC.1